MGRSLAILGVPGVLDGGGAADTSFSMTVTTTGAQQLKLDGLTVSADTVVYWGDGSSNTYSAGAGARTHNYAGAGTWTVYIDKPENVTLIDLRDTKITSVTGANLSKMVNLTSLTLNGIGTACVWTVNNDAPMPGGLTYLTLNTLANLTWDVGSVAGANMPANATSVTIVSTGTVTIAADDVLPAPMTTFRFENGLNAAAVDAVLAALYLAFPTRTGTAGTIDLLGNGNAAPTGVSPGGAECPPTTGWNTAYELVNDSCGVSAKHWASVTCQT